MTDAVFKSHVIVALVANAIAVGMVSILSLLFITTLMRKHQHEWYTYLSGFCLAAVIGIIAYTAVYLAFGYLPMSHEGPDVLQRLRNLELALAYHTISGSRAGDEALLPRYASVTSPI